MLNQILVALLTGATALGIPMGDQENHNQDNNAPSVSNVQRAYYDSSEVSNYGTTALTLYNYTSNDLYMGYVVSSDNQLVSATDNSFSLNPNASATFRNTSGGGYYNSQTETWMPDQKIALDEYNAEKTLDIYINGVFSAETLWRRAYGPSGYYFTLEVQNLSATDYIWLFDHQEPKMEDGIFEVVGDTLTAFASTIGVGFTAMIQIFYNDGVTPLGILALIVLGVSLVWFAWNLISSLLRQRR